MFHCKVPSTRGIPVRFNLECLNHLYFGYAPTWFRNLMRDSCLSWIAANECRLFSLRVVERGCCVLQGYVKHWQFRRPKCDMHFQWYRSFLFWKLPWGRITFILLFSWRSWVNLVSVTIGVLAAIRSGISFWLFRFELLNDSHHTSLPQFWALL